LEASKHKAAARLRDGANRNAQVDLFFYRKLVDLSRKHEGYWNSLLDLRTRWHLLGQQTATKYNVGVGFGFNVISTLDTVLDICMDDVHEDEEKSADSEKQEI